MRSLSERGDTRYWAEGMQDQGRDFRMGETYACLQTEGKQALVRDDLKTQEREDNRRQMFKANCFSCGHFYDLKDCKKKKRGRP